MVLKNVRDKAEEYWTLTKKTLALLSVWGLIFSVVTICRLGVAFDYDDTLVFSKAAYQRGFSSAVIPYSPQFWEAVNRSYDVERPQLIPYSLAWIFRAFGFRVAILSSRSSYGADGLKKEWRHLVPASRFFFASGEEKVQILQNGNYVLFFGDSDSDIESARRAHVFPVRIIRNPHALSKDDYHPGSLREVVIPFSDYSIAG